MRFSTWFRLFALLSFTQFVFPDSEVQYRAWQFHVLKPAYVSESMKIALGYDVNTVVFSHEMIGFTSDLYDGTDRPETLRRLAREAHQLNLKVWIWVRELNDVPDRFMDKKVVDMDRPGFWEWFRARYEGVFQDFPEFDGVMLTFHETPYKVFSPSVRSALRIPDRFARMINTVDEVCASRGKELIVRTFLYQPEELEWFRAGIKQTKPRVIIQSKCEPHDWDPFYPHEPLIGAFPDHPHIIEFDGSSEFTGKNRVPYTSPEYFEHRWRYDLAQPGICGYNVRVDHGGYDAIHTPNEINLHALRRMSQDPKISATKIWKEWTEKHYGAEAAPYVESALRPTFDVVNDSFFALKFWITKHSALPDYKYAMGHISSRTLAKWYPDQPEYKELERRLLHPDPQLLEQILREKDRAIAKSEACLLSLQKGKKYLKPEQYDDLYWRLELLHRTAIIWKLHAEAAFGYSILASGQQVPGLWERVERAIQALYAQAEVSAENPLIGEDPPASAKEIRKVADELKKMLETLRPAS